MVFSQLSCFYRNLNQTQQKSQVKASFSDDLLHQIIGLDRYIKQDKTGICYTGLCTYNIFQRVWCLGLTSYNR